jgi:hypothetical protein
VEPTNAEFAIDFTCHAGKFTAGTGRERAAEPPEAGTDGLSER